MLIQTTLFTFYFTLDTYNFDYTHCTHEFVNITVVKSGAYTDIKFDPQSLSHDSNTVILHLNSCGHVPQPQTTYIAFNI